MRTAVVTSYVEGCYECPFCRFIGVAPFEICDQLSQEDALPFHYVPIQKGKFEVRADCPLPESKD